MGLTWLRNGRCVPAGCFKAANGSDWLPYVLMTVSVVSALCFCGSFRGLFSRWQGFGGSGVRVQLGHSSAAVQLLQH
jgi:hypothetical protein